MLRSIEMENGSDGRLYHHVQLDAAIQSSDRLSMRELARQLVKKGAIKLPKEGEEGALDFGPEDELVKEGEEDEEAVPVDVKGDSTEEDVDEERVAVENAVLVGTPCLSCATPLLT